ncbi:hypothetical protein [Nostoc sp. PA-18-2419]|uniref:hypothetical protein n=1 Tax=Nostoc sp. PA-18-2419 TaxID=2575443 RepID=UPI00167BD226|nr:hypothetical protein [Nostoc sp. PA-18-2419]
MSRREDTCSAASVPNPGKWSHEAIVAFVKCTTSTYAQTHTLRRILGRIQVLASCRSWNDDPVLVIVIKKLLVKYP